MLKIFAEETQRIMKKTLSISKESRVLPDHSGNISPKKPFQENNLKTDKYRSFLQENNEQIE